MRATRLLAVALVVLLSATACRADQAVDVIVSGSSTVEPVSALLAERLVERQDDVAITVDGPGTGDGFELFCRGEIDVADASRPIKEPEVEACRENGVPYVELTIAIDGISIVTAPGSGIAECLGFADLYALVGPESEGFDTWSDANDLAAEIGAGHAPYPDEPLVIFGPGEESGTFDSFVEIVIEDIAEEREQDATTRPDYTSTPNDNVIVSGVSGTPTGLGWLGYAFYAENRGRLEAVAVEGDAGCVLPTPETIADGTYPVARRLYIYVNLDRAASSPGLRSYIELYLSEQGVEAVEEAGYVPLPAEQRQAVRETWERALREIQP